MTTLSDSQKKFYEEALNGYTYLEESRALHATSGVKTS